MCLGLVFIGFCDENLVIRHASVTNSSVPVTRARHYGDRSPFKAISRHNSDENVPNWRSKLVTIHLSLKRVDTVSKRAPSWWSLLSMSTTHKTLLICGFGQYFGKLTMLTCTVRIYSLSAEIIKVRNVLITPKYRVIKSCEVGRRGHL